MFIQCDTGNSTENMTDKKVILLFCDFQKAIKVYCLIELFKTKPDVTKRKVKEIVVNQLVNL